MASTAAAGAVLLMLWMGDVFYWIYDYPTWEIGLLFAAFFLTTSLSGLFLFRFLLSQWIHTENRANEMVAVALGSFSLLYGILLGLVAVGAYQNFSSITDLVTREASSLTGLYRDISALPEPYGSRLQADLRNYTRFTIDYGWRNPGTARSDYDRHTQQ